MAEPHHVICADSAGLTATIECAPPHLTHLFGHTDLYDLLWNSCHGNAESEERLHLSGRAGSNMASYRNSSSSCAEISLRYHAHNGQTGSRRVR